MDRPTPKIIVFTGAGISADSGLSTFRGNGLWDQHKVEDICTLRTWKRNFALVHRFYNERRVQLAGASPNRPTGSSPVGPTDSTPSSSRRTSTTCTSAAAARTSSTSTAA
jgi:NAD-dependent deacetylase